MSKIRSKPHLLTSPIKEYLKSSSNATAGEDDFFLISFRHIDREQSEDFTTWEQRGILSKMMDTLTGYCHAKLESQFSKKFTCYGAFPPPEKAGYKCPTYIPEDAKWARIHVNGTQIVAGHIVRNVFYVVFLDPDHKFYKTDIQDRGK